MYKPLASLLYNVLARLEPSLGSVCVLLKKERARRLYKSHGPSVEGHGPSSTK